MQSETDAAGVAVAKDAAIGAIQDPVSLFMQQRSMLSMAPIQALAKKAGTSHTMYERTSHDHFHSLSIQTLAQIIPCLFPLFLYSFFLSFHTLFHLF